MKVSVIIPNYNHSKYLKQRIESVLSQSFRDYELIILDDYSVDDSRNIIDDFLKRFPYIKHYYNNSNSGNAFMQWDNGVRKASGEYVWIAESDDFAEPGFLEKAVSVMEKNKSAGLVYCNSRVIDEIKNEQYLVSDIKADQIGGRWSVDYINNGLNELTDYLYLNNTINNVSGVLFRKKVYIEAGYADHSMNYCGDWFMYNRIMQRSAIAYLAEPLNTIRFHEGSSFHKYYIKSTYFLEVLRIYLYTDSMIRLKFSKKLAMGKVLLKIIILRLLNGSIPEFGKAIKMLLNKKSAFLTNAKA